jgi:hypothetical protein
VNDVCLVYTNFPPTSIMVDWEVRTGYKYSTSNCEGDASLMSLSASCAKTVNEMYGLPASSIWQLTSSNSNNDRMSAGAVAGITVGVIVFVVAISLSVFYFFFRKGPAPLNKQEIAIGVVPSAVAK